MRADIEMGCLETGYLAPVNLVSMAERQEQWSELAASTQLPEMSPGLIELPNQLALLESLPNCDELTEELNRLIEVLEAKGRLPEFVMVRHLKTHANGKSRVQGPIALPDGGYIDSPLAPESLQSATFDPQSTDPAHWIYTGTLSRLSATALAKGWGPEQVRRDPKLNERWQGGAAGMPKDEHPEGYDLMQGYRGGMNFSMHAISTLSWLRDMLSECLESESPPKKVTIVTSKGNMRVLAGVFGEAELEDIPHLHFDNGAEVQVGLHPLPEDRLTKFEPGLFHGMHSFRRWHLLQSLSTPGGIHNWQNSLDVERRHLPAARWYRELPTEIGESCGVERTKYGQVTLHRSNDRDSPDVPRMMIRKRVDQDPAKPPHDRVFRDADYCKNVTKDMRDSRQQLLRAGLQVPITRALVEQNPTQDDQSFSIVVEQEYIAGPTLLDLWQDALSEGRPNFHALESVLYIFLEQAKRVHDFATSAQTEIHEAGSCEHGYSGIDCKPHNFVVREDANGCITAYYIDLSPPMNFDQQGRLMVIAHQGVSGNQLETASEECFALRCSEHLFSHAFLELMGASGERVSEIMPWLSHYVEDWLMLHYRDRPEVADHFRHEIQNGFPAFQKIMSGTIRERVGHVLSKRITQ